LALGVFSPAGGLRFRGDESVTAKSDQADGTIVNNNPSSGACVSRVDS
jgi:hypothetical protein